MFHSIRLCCDQTFSPDVNILIGANGTGKTHFLKVLYSACTITGGEGTMWQRMNLLLIILLCVAFVGCVDELQRGTAGGLTTSAGSGEEDHSPQRERPELRTGTRVALVIGNGDYQDTNHLTKLRNPTNDAEDVSKALRGFGFEVITGKNMTRRAMKEAIATLGRKAGNAEVALFYFAGHGIQSKNQNYLMPVDATVHSLAEVAEEGVSLNYPLDEMDNAKSKINIVMLDACRNNPFTGEFRGGGGRGLAPPSDMPKGTVIVYATDPGNTAEDGQERNGLFTAGLRVAFAGKDLSLDGVLTVASEWVEEKSNRRQTPYVNGPKTVQKHFYFSSPSGGKQPATTLAQQDIPQGITPIPEKSRLSALEEQRKAEEARLVEIEKQRQELEQQRREAEEGARLAEVEGKRKREEARLVEMEQQRREAEQRRQEAEARVGIQTSRIKVSTGQLIHGRYRDHGDGTVTDIQTQLRWKRCAEGQTWTGSSCSGTPQEYKWDDLPATQNGWRVPTHEELKSLVYCSSTGVFGSAMKVNEICSGNYQRPAIDQEAFPNTPASSFWSGSPVAGSSNYAWFVSFDGGYDYWGSRNDAYAVRLVRGGQ
ncbi:putative CASPASE_P20 domain-containing protein [Gammaproteobacteria bacterium]